MATKRKPAAGKHRFSEPKGKLHVLLARAFPEHRTATYDLFDIAWLAQKLKVTDEAVYVWLRNDKLPSLARARDILKIRGCRVDIDDLLPFVP